jgi:hypothetical protein
MLMLVATKQTQGQRRNDFSWTREGELVNITGACDSDHDPDGHCGCKRAFTGLTGFDLLEASGAWTLDAIPLIPNRLLPVCAFESKK